MSRHHSQIFHVLLLFLFAHAVYTYVNSEIFIRIRPAGEPEYHTEIRNPLRIIFVGRSASSEENTSHMDYPAGDRAIHFSKLLLIGLFLVAIVRYFLPGKRTGLLLFLLLTLFWTEVGELTFRPFYYAWSLLHPDLPVMTYNFRWSLLYIILPKIGALIFLIGMLQRMNNREPQADTTQDFLPLKWMRGFHALGDRVLIMLFAFNVFVWRYYDATAGSGFSIAIPVDLLQNWSILSLQAGFLMSYLLCEGLFQVSPMKVLTGTQVVSETGQPSSWIKIIGRSLARLIPLNEVSFIFTHGWHDTLSDTTVRYISTEGWLHRISRLVRSFFFFYLLITVWTIVTAALQFGEREFGFELAAALPQLLLVTVFPIVFLLFVCYIASISNLAHNLNADKRSHESIHFISALLWWVPFLNYRIPGSMLYDASYYLTRHDPELAEEHRRHTTVFCRLYGLAYTLLGFGIFVYIMANSRVESLLGIVITAFALSTWCVATLVYAGKLKKLSITTL